MNIDFKKLMSEKSDDGLQHYLDNIDSFRAEAAEAAIAEFEKRGRIFSDDELTVLRQKIAARRQFLNQREQDPETSSGFFPWRKNIVKDPEAPHYYPRWAILVFAYLFSTLFGAIMLAINFNKTKNIKAVWSVITFGVVYTLFTAWINYRFAPPRSSGIALGALGAGILDWFFWVKYIGKETRYRSRSVLIPLIIALAIFIPFFLLLVNQQG